MIDVSLVGTGGMMPLPERFLSSLMCRINGRLILIDCGEGTQVSLKLLKWGFKSIDAICITHYHADHISGLPGLLLTIGNAGRTEPLTMLGPPGLEHVVRSMCVIAPELNFPLIFRESGVMLNEVRIRSLPLAHRIPCFAYSLEINRAGRFDTERAEATGLPKKMWSRLQKGGEVLWEGKVYTSDMVLGPPRKGIKISYCTDTRPVASLPEFIYGSDLFVCEGMYGDETKKDKAIGHRHMLFSEAAAIAKAGQVKELWLTHFSPSMAEPEEFISAAADIFPNTQVGRDRMCRTINFEEGSDIF